MIKLIVEKINEDSVTFTVIIENIVRHIDFKVDDVIEINEKFVELFRPSPYTNHLDVFMRSYP